MATQVRDAAHKVVQNVYLLALQRISSVFIVPLVIWIVVTFFTLRDNDITKSLMLQAQAADIAAVRTQVGTMRSELTSMALHMARLQTQRESDAQITQRVDELRSDIQRISSRIDQMLTPPTRRVP